MGAATVSGRGTSHLRTPIRALGPRFSFRRRAGANDTPDPGLDGRYISPQKMSHDAGAMSAGTRAHWSRSKRARRRVWPRGEAVRPRTRG
jgi:hypothetical protein